MTERNFFITGLPRSRTSWFAAFMSSGDVFCWHEAINGCHTKQEFSRRMALDGYSVVGNSDSGLVFTDFAKRFPGARTVIIHRDIDEVIESLIDGEIIDAGKRAEANTFLYEMTLRLEDTEGLHVDFEEIDNRIEEIYRFCTGREPDPNRIRLFHNLKVEPVEVLPDMKSYEIWMRDQ